MISSFLLMGVALAYILLKLHVERRRAPRRDACDATLLSVLAFERRTSAHELFVEAGRMWSFSDTKIEQDFNRYLRKGDIPHYVGRFLRRQPARRPSYQSTLFVTNDLPPNTSP